MRKRRLTVSVLEDVHDREDLSVVGHECFTDILCGQHEVLNGVQCPRHDGWYAGLQRH